MKILLINPVDNYNSMNPKLDSYIRGHGALMELRSPSLTMMTVAALVPPDIEIEYIDENSEPVPAETDAELVGIGGMTQQATRAHEIADAFRAQGKTVVMGGVHATLLPDEALEHADAVVIGEAEESFPRLIRDFRAGKLQERYLPTPIDLKLSPMPRFDLIRQYDFSKSALPMLPIQLSRGCPRDCSFCTVTRIYGRRFRVKSVKQAMRELETMMQYAPDAATVIRFNDDNPYINKRFIRALLRAMEPLKLRWLSLADISIAEDPETLELIRRAGCYMVNIGFESVDPNSLKEVGSWKLKQLKVYEQNIRIMNDHGLMAGGSFMFGFDHDTPDTFRWVRDFVLKNKVPSKFSIVTPFPGTALYRSLQEQGRIWPEIPWMWYNFLNVVYDTVMPAEQIEENLLWLYENAWSDEATEMMRKAHREITERGRGLAV